MPSLPAPYFARGVEDSREDSRTGAALLLSFPSFGTIHGLFPHVKESLHHPLQVGLIVLRKQLFTHELAMSIVMRIYENSVLILSSLLLFGRRVSHFKFPFSNLQNLWRKLTPWYSVLSHGWVSFISSDID